MRRLTTQTSGIYSRYRARVSPLNYIKVEVDAIRSAGTYNPDKLLGVTKLDVVRAKAFVAEILGVDPVNVTVPVVGGHAGVTILPLLSQVRPAAERRPMRADSQRA